MITPSDKRLRQLKALRALRIDSLAVNGRNISGLVLKAVLRAIDDHGSRCWASAATIADEICGDDRSVRRAIKALCEAGLISIAAKQGSSSSICINWDAVEKLSNPGPTVTTNLEPSDFQTNTSEGSHPGPWVTPDPGSPRTHGPTTPDPGSGDPGPTVLRSGKEAEGKRKEVATLQLQEFSVPTSGKSKTKSLNFATEDMQAARHLWDRITRTAGKHHDPNFEKWADTIRMIRTIDGKDIAEINRMIDFAHDHDFWKSNILSPEKLRKHWLRLQAESKPKANGYQQNRPELRPFVSGRK